MKKTIALLFILLFFLSAGCAKPTSAEFSPLPTAEETAPPPSAVPPTVLLPSPTEIPAPTATPDQTVPPTPAPTPAPTPKSIKPTDTASIESTASQYYVYEDIKADKATLTTP